ncbi:MAG: metallophosphoesterase [Planctomycetota bacterium]|nr:MAG: metallophosphoesterase [Planctomycetota bacterium]
MVDEYAGLLVIGDPHLSGRTPNFRSDDYARVILDKFAWALRYADAHRLLPTMLGDLFDRPRDNPTWMLGSLIDLLADTNCIGIYGNHDCANPELGDDDSLSLLVKSGRIRMLDGAPWRGVMNGRTVIVGGSSYRKQIPNQFELSESDTHGASLGNVRSPLVFWISHHDLIVPGYEEEGRIHPVEIPGVNLVINGHIHRRLDDVERGATLWMTPGNISRRSRSDATMHHTPSVLRIDITEQGYERTFIEVPHELFEDVFHPAVVDAVESESKSSFVAGLAQLQARRTEGGAGLMEFLAMNLDQFEASIADMIRKLAQEVTRDGIADTNN